MAQDNTPPIIYDDDDDSSNIPPLIDYFPPLNDDDMYDSSDDDIPPLIDDSPIEPISNTLTLPTPENVHWLHPQNFTPAFYTHGGIQSQTFYIPIHNTVTGGAAGGGSAALGGGGSALGGSEDSVIQQSFETDREKYKYVLSDEASSILAPVPFSTIDSEETKCSIMQELFETDTMVVQLPCKHVFCHEAISQWVENENATCPVCRYKLPCKEIKNDDAVEYTRPQRSVTQSQAYRQFINAIYQIQQQHQEDVELQMAIMNSLN